MSEPIDTNQETTTTSIATNNHHHQQQQQQHADKTLIQYIQDVILQIKKDHVQCNLKSIFNYLKQQHADYAAVQELNEKELMKQLEMGVRDGILSRKFGGNNSSSNSNNNGGTRSVSGESVVVARHRTAIQLISPQTNEAFKLPNVCVLNFNNDNDMYAYLDEYKKLINEMVSVLIKVVFSLSKKRSSSLNEICKYLHENYRFETIGNKETTSVHNGDDSMGRLKACVKYLFKKHEKIFLVKCDADLGDEQRCLHDDEKGKYCLNPGYIEQKIKSEENAQRALQAAAAKAVLVQKSPTTPLKQE